MACTHTHIAADSSTAPNKMKGCLDICSEPHSGNCYFALAIRALHFIQHHKEPPQQEKSDQVHPLPAHPQEEPHGTDQERYHRDEPPSPEPLVYRTFECVIGRQSEWQNQQA